MQTKGTFRMASFDEAVELTLGRKKKRPQRRASMAEAYEGAELGKKGHKLKPVSLARFSWDKP